MTLQPRFVPRALAALVAVALLLSLYSGDRTPASGRASLDRNPGRRQTERDRAGGRGAGPREKSDRLRGEPVGRHRVVVPPMPEPIAAGNGGVYVPRSLAQIPFFQEPGPVADDIAVEVNGHGAAPARGALPSRAMSVSANARANDTALDPAGSTQSENTIAALGLNVIAGWNDGTNFLDSPGGTGYAYSTNGGLTWTDGGVLPVPNSTCRHQGDPCLTNDNAGHFYFADLYTPDNAVTSAIAVCKGTFAGGGVVWGMPVMVATTASDFLDKDWMAADKVGGNVYVSYTRFLAAGGNQIECSRSTTGGATWDPPIVLTSPAAESVQGSRIVVGPSGEVQVIYFVDDVASGNNYMRARRSTTAGTSWGPEVTLPAGPSGIISNFGSGPAGFNRSRGIGFPGLAIDNTAGANSGRVYATWEETVNFYSDVLGSLGPVAEVEGNGSSATATPILVGSRVGGFMSSTSDEDWFSFTGSAGQTAIIYLVPGTGDGYLRLFAGGGGLANRAQLSYIGFGTGLCVYTLPSSGTYYFRVQANGLGVGTYTVYTGWDAPNPGDEVARDTRDVIVQSSPDGVVWDARRVVNDDAPRFDNAFPEVAVDAAGQVFVDWYDHRIDPLGINTDIYYSRSSNGSVSFLPSIKVNDGPSINWSLVGTNLMPNMGDYSALVADGCNVYANFADGREGSPDAWVATIKDCATTGVISLVLAQARPDRVDLGWYAADVGDVLVSVFRREQNTAWTEVGSIRTDGSGRLDFRDVSVRAGSRYGYRIGIRGATGMEFFGEVWVDVPVGVGLAFQRVTNPVIGDLDVSFTLQSADPATIQLIDVTGRAVETVRVTASGRTRLGGQGLASGVYWVKLTQRGRSVMARTVVVR